MSHRGSSEQWASPWATKGQEELAKMGAKSPSTGDKSSASGFTDIFAKNKNMPTSEEEIFKISPHIDEHPPKFDDTIRPETTPTLLRTVQPDPPGFTAGFPTARAVVEFGDIIKDREEMLHVAPPHLNAFPNRRVEMPPHELLLRQMAQHQMQPHHYHHAFPGSLNKRQDHGDEKFLSTEFPGLRNSSRARQDDLRKGWEEASRRNAPRSLLQEDRSGLADNGIPVLPRHRRGIPHPRVKVREISANSFSPGQSNVLSGRPNSALDDKDENMNNTPVPARLTSVARREDPHPYASNISRAKDQTEIIFDRSRKELQMTPISTAPIAIASKPNTLEIASEGPGTHELTLVNLLASGVIDLPDPHLYISEDYKAHWNRTKKPRIEAWRNEIYEVDGEDSPDDAGLLMTGTWQGREERTFGLR